MQYGSVLIFVAAVLWGLDGIFRRSLASLPASAIVFYEHLIGAIVIAPWFYRAWKAETLARKEWLAVALVALLSGVLGTLLFTAALLQIDYIPFSAVFLVQKLQPVFTVVTARVVLSEPITRRYAAWAGIALVAAYFVTFPDGVINTAQGGGQVAAAALAFLAAVAWGSSTAFSRYALLHHSHTLVTGLRFMLTVPIAFAFVVGLGNWPSLAMVTGRQLATLAAIAVSTGMVAIWIYYRGLRTTEARVSTIIELAFPLTGVVIDYFLYGTTLTTAQYAAATVLLFAMYRVSSLTARSGSPA